MINVFFFCNKNKKINIITEIIKSTKPAILMADIQPRNQPSGMQEECHIIRLTVAFSIFVVVSIRWKATITHIWTVHVQVYLGSLTSPERRFLLTQYD